MDSNAFQLHLATEPTLDDILRDGARRALQAAIEQEVEQYIQRNKDHLDEEGRRLVVRNEHHPARKIQSGNGPIEVRQPHRKHVCHRATANQQNQRRRQQGCLPGDGI